MGARGLRSIIEKILQDTMFETPSNPDIAKVIINEDTVKDGGTPEIVTSDAKKDKYKIKRKDNA
jgi:ATP-dependent Clp protease ATP-binding subunit ClpX